MHDARVIARTCSGHGRTVGGELRAAAIGAHVALNAETRGRSRQTHIVKLADDAFRTRYVCEVRSAQDTYRSPHTLTGSMLDTEVGSSEFLVNYAFELK